MKEIMYRPKKMRLLYERYWQLASETEKNLKIEGEKKLKLKY
jgi:hypothetical protein